MEEWAREKVPAKEAMTKVWASPNGQAEECLEMAPAKRARASG